MFDIRFAILDSSKASGLIAKRSMVKIADAGNTQMGAKSVCRMTIMSAMFDRKKRIQLSFLNLQRDS